VLCSFLPPASPLSSSSRPIGSHCSTLVFSVLFDPRYACFTGRLISHVRIGSFLPNPLHCCFAAPANLLFCLPNCFHEELCVSLPPPPGPYGRTAAGLLPIAGHERAALQLTAASFLFFSVAGFRSLQTEGPYPASIELPSAVAEAGSKRRAIWRLDIWMSRVFPTPLRFRI